MKCKDVNVFWEWISQAVQGIKTNPEFVPDWSSLPSHLWDEAEDTLDRELRELSVQARLSLIAYSNMIHHQ